MKSVSQKVSNQHVDKDVTVLIVDDSKVIRLALNKILRNDFNVIQANDGEDAWDKLSGENEISAIFSDVSMPNLDGFGLLDRVRQSSRSKIANLPFIIITGNDDDPGFSKKVSEHGGDALITKPFNTNEITQCIEKYISIDSEAETEDEPLATSLSSESDFADILGFDSLDTNAETIEPEQHIGNTEVENTSDSSLASLDFDFTVNEDFMDHGQDLTNSYDEVDEIDFSMPDEPAVDTITSEPADTFNVTEEKQDSYEDMKLEIDFGDTPDALPAIPQDNAAVESGSTPAEFKLEIEQARKRAVDIARDKALEEEQNQEYEDTQRVSETQAIRERLKALRQRESSLSAMDKSRRGFSHKIALTLGKLMRIIIKITTFRK